MGELLLPTAPQDWKRPPVHEPERALITQLGLAEGDVLTCLEEHGFTTLRRLIRELDWPASIIMMAIGALVRARLILAIQHDLEILIQLNEPELNPRTTD